jgi:hypothetical protein
LKKLLVLGGSTVEGEHGVSSHRQHPPLMLNVTVRPGRTIDDRLSHHVGPTSNMKASLKKRPNKYRKSISSFVKPVFNLGFESKGLSDRMDRPQPCRFDDVRACSLLSLDIWSTQMPCESSSSHCRALCSRWCGRFMCPLHGVKSHIHSISQRHPERPRRGATDQQ